MPIPHPTLDDRSYQQLRDELVRRIPVYAREWTDHNASDPGITLIELFAFLGENLLYRFNQIPDATRLAFLRMLQIPLRPAAAARALITLTRTDTGAESVLVPIGTQVMAGSVPFQTLTEVSAWPLEITAIGRIVSQAPQTADAQEFTNAAIDARGGIKQGEQAAYYLNQTVPGDPTAAGAEPVDFQIAAGPVDFGKSVDGAIWIAVRKTDNTDLSKLRGKLLSIGYVPDQEVPSIEQVDACPGVAPADNGSELIWKASTGTISNGKPTYLELKLEADTTLSLAQQGTLQIRLPTDITSLGVYALSDPDLQGTDAFPPQIEDAQLAANVLFWLRVSRRDSARPLGKVLFIGINATEVVQTIKAQPEFLGTGSAQPNQTFFLGTSGAQSNQTFTLVHKPVLQGTARIQVEESGDWTDWQAVDGFEASAEDSRHYVLDLEAGTVRFGNGV